MNKVYGSIMGVSPFCLALGAIVSRCVNLIFNKRECNISNNSSF